jgi:hypothetical protein
MTNDRSEHIVPGKPWEIYDLVITARYTLGSAPHAPDGHLTTTFQKKPRPLSYNFLPCSMAHERLRTTQDSTVMRMELFSCRCRLFFVTAAIL